jgi:hypothetical protein
MVDGGNEDDISPMLPMPPTTFMIPSPVASEPESQPVTQSIIKLDDAVPAAVEVAFEPESELDSEPTPEPFLELTIISVPVMEHITNDASVAAMSLEDVPVPESQLMQQVVIVVEASPNDPALISPEDIPVPESKPETQSIQEPLVISTPVAPNDAASIQHDPGVFLVPVVEVPAPLEGVPEPELEPSLIVSHPIPEDAVLQESGVMAGVDEGIPEEPELSAPVVDDAISEDVESAGLAVADAFRHEPVTGVADAVLTLRPLSDLSLTTFDMVSTVGRSSSSEEESEDNYLPRRRRRVRRSVQRERRALREQEQATLLTGATMAQATIQPDPQSSTLQARPQSPSSQSAPGVGSSSLSEVVAPIEPEHGHLPRRRRRVRRSVQRERQALREAAALGTIVAPAAVQLVPQSSSREVRPTLVAEQQTASRGAGRRRR